MAGDVNLGTAEGKIVIDASEAKKGAKDAADAVSESIKKQEAASDRLKTAGATAAKAYGVAVVGGLGLAVKAAMDFDQALANVAAAGGKDAESQMERVRQKALQLGADTSFSSTEAANAMEALIKAGLSVDDVLGGAADAAVALAAAESISIPEAAEIAATAMTAFNMKASEMPEIANEISQAASATKMDVTDFAQAMNQAGAVSKLVGLDFNDMTLAITAMGKSGIIGSDAGTSLKTMLMNLQPSTVKQTTLFKELGLMTEDGANKFFDATGKIKSMTEIAGILQSSLKGMTDQQKQATLETLFGSDAIRAAAIITEQGAAGMKKLTAEMNGQLSVADKAARKQDTLAGQYEKMKGSMEAAAIQVGTVLIPVLRDLAGFLEGLADWFSALPAPVKEAVVWFGVGSTALLGFGFVAVKTVRIIKDINTVFGITKGIVAFKNALGVARIWIALTASDMITKIGGAGPKIASGLSTARTAIGVWAIDAVAATKRAAAATASGAKTIVTSFASTAAAMAKNAARMVATAAVHVAQWIRMAAVATARAAMIAAAWLIANPWALIAAAIIALVVLIIMNWDKIKQFLTTVWNAIKAVALTVWNAIKAFFEGWWTLITSLFTTATDGIRIIVETVWNVIKAIFETALNAIKIVVETVWNVIKTIIETVMGIIKGIIDVFMGIITGDWQRAWDGVKQIFSSIWNGIKGIVNTVWEGIKSIFSNALNGIKNVVSSVFNGVVDFVSNIPGRILGALGDFGKLLWDMGKALITGLWNGISNALGWLWDKIKGIASGIADAFSSVLEIFSPSRVFRDFGKYTIEGYVVGIDKNQKLAYDAVSNVASNVASTGSSAFGGDGTSSAMTTNNYGASVSVEFKVYNPRPEPASDTAARKMRTLSEMGAFG